MSRRSKKNVPQPQPARPAAAKAATPGKWVVCGVCVLLAALAWAVFGRTLGHEFVNYDDNIYVYENPHVTCGLSLKTIGWAFNPAHNDLYLWTPLATISHMVDCQIYGLKPWGHHLTNVLLHIATVMALFLVLRQMTGALWRSAFVAAVFAIHPLHVESVAWVAERKDVLSGLFFMFTLGAYVFYVRKRSVARYVVVMLLFAFGLMAKQMIVTLPCVLLLLDYWPLGRFAQTPGAAPARSLVFFQPVIEKLPLFALSIASCVQTLMAGKDLRKVVPVAHPFLLRAGNALVCYVVYIFRMFYPANLSVYYPYPAAVPAWEALGALALLAGISIAAFAWRGRHPAFLAGWFWYLGMLAPVIGFVPVGREGHADRYTYLPLIGLSIAITWVCADACARLRLPRAVPAAAMGAVIAALAICASVQVSYWRNDESLWDHALSITPDSSFVRNNLGFALESDGDLEGALAQYRLALEIQPGYPEAHNNMGNALSKKGDMEGAIAQYKLALESNPDYLEAVYNLGYALSAKGELEEAIIEFRRAIIIKPDYADAHRNLANDLLLTNRLDEAIIEYGKALDINPHMENAWFNLARILLYKGRVAEAVAGFKKVLEITPHDAYAQNDLAHVLATSPDASLRNGEQALKLAREANQTTGGQNPVVLETLAAAYAETGDFSGAANTAQQALDLAEPQSNAELANALRFQIALYQAREPFRDKSLTGGVTHQP